MLISPRHGALCALFVLATGCSSHTFVTPEAAQPILFKGVQVFDAPNARAFEGLRDVLIKDGRIAAMDTSLADVAGARVVQGGFLMPGLIDAHVHLGGGSAPPWLREIPDEEENLGAFLYAGVTTVLDVGNLTPEVFELRDDVEAGKVLGPRIFAAGPIFTTPGGHPAAMMRQFAPWPLSLYIVSKLTREVATADEARAAVEALLPLRPDVIKVAVDRIPTDVPRITQDVVAGIAQAARKGGLRTVAHVGRSQDVVDAVAAGVEALVHGVYTEDMSNEAIAALARGKVPVVMTSSVFDVQRRMGPDAPDFIALEKEIARPEVLSAMRAVPADFDRTRFEPWVLSTVDGHQARRKNIARMRAAGVTVLAGSDSPNVNHVPGAGLHLELDALREGGMTEGEALRAATSDNARLLAGDTADFGQVAVGQRADLLWLKDSPLTDFSRIHEPGLVIRAGLALKRIPREK